MTQEIMSTRQKALTINLDAGSYGAFAEIGAGQEVARWFFRVGGAAGTIAKTMSAYDMTISDAIYGHTDRYVSRERLQSMLDHEYDLLLQRLGDKRGESTRFFAFGDTVAARGYKRAGNSHGWMGIRFQARAGLALSDIIIHVSLLDPDNVQQQEALGIVGVNLIYGALHHHPDPTALIVSILDNLGNSRVEVDMIKFSGPAFGDIDNRLMSLVLVEKGLTNAAIFTSSGEVVQAAEVLHKKPILIERGSFRPVTHVSVDMLECAHARFIREPRVAGEPIVVLMEMTLPTLLDEGHIDHRDFLDRVDILGALGRTVMISNYVEYHRLATYLFGYTKKMIGIALGVPTLKEVFDEKHYTDLEGGILESFGRLFKNDLKLFVYPMRDPSNGSVVTAGNIQVAAHLKHLHSYLIENQCIEDLRNYNEAYLPIYSKDVLARIRSGDPSWMASVPPQVAHLIKERRLFQSNGGHAGQRPRRA